MSAIVPMYGDLSRPFVTLESGAISHHLETWSVGRGLGLCQIGNLDAALVQSLLQLSDRHVLIHSLVGGQVDPEMEAVSTGEFAATTNQDWKRSRLVRRIQALTPEETKALLEAQRRHNVKGCE
jgi:hypothetical protein